MIKAITFDLWRTLFIETAHESSVRYGNAAMLAILAERGYGVKESELLAALDACRALAFKAQKEDGLDFIPEDQVPWIIAHLGLPADAGLTAALLDPYTNSLLAVPPRLVDGEAMVLEELSRDYQLALICNTGRTPGRTVREVMRRFDLLAYFATTIFSNELKIAKPNPRIFAAALSDLGVAPAEAVHIGDDPLTDVGGAKGAGMKAVWFNPYGDEAEPPYDFRITDLKELLELGRRRFV